MNRTQKQEFVTELAQGLDKASTFALLSFNKLSVEQMTAFRLSLRKQNVHVKVVKNTLAKRVFDATPYKEASVHFEGPTLLAYSEGDPVVTAKAITEWAKKENFDLKIKAGAALGQVMSQSQLEALSKLPGRNELLVMFLWALKSHPTRFLNALQDAPRRLGYALSALSEKKQNAQ